MSAPALRVASFNVRNARALDGLQSWPFRRRSTAAMARHLDADLLAVQEAYACQARYLDRSLPEHSRYGRGRNATRGGEWCAVLVRTARLRVEEASTRWFGDDPDRPGSRLPGALFPRVATRVRAVDLATGTELELFNTHLDERRPENRLRSIELLVAWLDRDVPTIVAGDFNATPDGEPALFTALHDAGLLAALPDDGRGTAHDFQGGTDHRRLDHLYVSRHWEVLTAGVIDADVGRRLPSDHWPVAANLRLR